MKVLFLISLFLFPFVLFSQQKDKKVKVLLLGTFHFENPGLDVAKFENANILSPKRQEEVQEVIKQLKKFGPDKIFVEAIPEMQMKLDSLYLLYKDDKWKLQSNEIFQLGFRLAKELKLPRVHAIDYSNANFPFDSLIKVLQNEKQFQLLQSIKTMIDSIENSFNARLKSSSLSQILVEGNSPKSDLINVGSYLNILPAGNKENHIGSYIASEWWRRNMIIYERLLKEMNGTEKKILVIFGSAHTALLKEFMKYNHDIELISVDQVLKK